jgi:hypothetical protein
MLPYSYIHGASLNQLLRWWDGIDSLPKDFEDGGVDEVAYALSKHVPDGVRALKRSLEAGDVQRRKSALYWLAFPDKADEQVRTALVQAFRSEPALKTPALWGFIHLGYFPLERASLDAVMEGDDQRLTALAMVYLSHAHPEESIQILREALRSRNPRMREYACDEIGDRGIEELKDEMRLLTDDADTDVAQAAARNL